MNFKPLRLSVVLLGDRLAIAALGGSRVEAFTVDAENPATALRAELDARGLPATKAFLAVARSAVTVKPIILPPVAGDVRQMVGFELDRNLPGTDDALVADELRRSLVALRWREVDAVWVSGDADAPHAPTSDPLSALGVPVTEPAWTSRAQHQLGHLGAEQRGALQLALAVAAGRSVRSLELLPAAARPTRLTRPQAFTVGMAAVTAALAIVALLAPGWREQRHLNRINVEMERVDPDVKAVDRVLRELERKRKLLATVDGVEAAGVRPLPVLRELTEIMPPDGWLTTISLDAKGVELTGAASAASALIPLLENSPRLERVEFASPVTRGRDNKEQFRIRAAWEAGGAVATTSAPPASGVVAPAPGAVAPPSGVMPPPGPPPPGTPPAAPRAPTPPRRPAPTAPPGGLRP